MKIKEITIGVSYNYQTTTITVELTEGISDEQITKIQNKALQTCLRSSEMVEKARVK